MNRDDALVYLNSTMDVVMIAAGRDLDDSVTGYKPALDSAFRQYITLYSLGTGLTDTTVPTIYEQCFEALLEAVAYDLAIKAVSATQADFSIDAPLTSIKFSQTYRALKDQRDDAWARAASCGYGLFASNVGAFKVNLDFNEPRPTGNGEYS